MKTFPKQYRCLNKSSFSNKEYSIIPIRYEDRLNIMKWRNEQMYHLRQNKPLTIENQNQYFENIVLPLFVQEKPNQILFSFLKNNTLIGYGGLVHINWIDKSAEISFVMNTQLEKENFEKYWSIYLGLIEKVAFESLNFNSIFTYAYNLRPKLYPILTNNGFKLKEILKNKIKINGKPIDVVIHEKKILNIRKANKSDVNLIFDWINDQSVREASFNSEKIEYEKHLKWFNNKIEDKNFIFYIFEYNKIPFSLVRFEINNFDSTIGILIDKGFRGKGLGVEVLILACENYFNENNNDILAYIKKSNISSIKTFKRAGFKLFKETEVKNTPCFVYVLKKEIND
ncbi:MAG TPA: GNAT family N-acetyltransferase [Crocinitomix sp.]|nr:GNAT family N-acetyltransferase [Crocinitomix sp.]